MSDSRPDPVNALTITGAQRKLVMAERRTAVLKLINRGFSLREIADKLGLTFGQVTGVQRKIMVEIERQFEGEARKHRARLLHKNLVLQRECWEHLDRAKQGHIRQDLEETEAAAVPTNPPTSGAAVGPRRKRTTRENDLMAEARILETLRKAQLDEAKLLAVVLRDDPLGPPSGGDTYNDNRTIIINNNAEIPSSAPWVMSIAAGKAEQGKGLLQAGDVQDAVVSNTTEQTPEVDKP